jgi:DNA-binding NarL/FixJ family response regulator
MSVKIAIVDDDIRLCQVLKSALLEFEEIDSVITHHSGLAFARDLEQMPLNDRPEIIIMDISMGLPDEGILATHRIRSKFPDIGVIMFTISDGDDHIFEAFRAGATGYLLKDEPPEFIVNTILNVHRGEAQMSPSIARKTIQFLVPNVSRKTRIGTLSDNKELSAREIEMLEQVAKGSTYAQIADQLFISTHTVKKHMVNIFAKLQVKNKIEALKKTEGLY